MMPQMKRFHYVGSFKSGLTAYDNAYMFTSIEALQTLLQKMKIIMMEYIFIQKIQ